MWCLPVRLDSRLGFTSLPKFLTAPGCKAEQRALEECVSRRVCFLGFGESERWDPIAWCDPRLSRVMLCCGQVTNNLCSQHVWQLVTHPKRSLQRRINLIEVITISVKSPQKLIPMVGQSSVVPEHQCTMNDLSHPEDPKQPLLNVMDCVHHLLPGPPVTSYSSGDQ